MRPTLEEIEDSAELVKACYRTADELLIERSIDPTRQDLANLTVPQVRVLLAHAAAQGYGAGATDMLSGIKPHLDTLRHEGAAIEHGKKIRVITASGKKRSPPGSFWDWVRKALF